MTGTNKKILTVDVPNFIDVALSNFRLAFKNERLSLEEMQRKGRVEKLLKLAKEEIKVLSK